MGWLFVISRLIEFMDTIFFVLRKNFHQVSILHVFHHTIVPTFIWFVLKLTPSLYYGFVPFINSFVHTIMYLYYGLSTFGPIVGQYLWWKKYLTRLQIIQFVLVIINSLRVFLIPDCKLSHSLMILSITFALIICSLFCSFYVKTYCKLNYKNKKN